MSHANASPPNPRVFSLSDGQGLQLDVLDIGATWWRLRLQLPGEAAPRELIIGGPDPLTHLSNRAYLGATVGRYANRIAHARLDRDGRTWRLATAPGQKHHLHGGPGGFHTRTWTAIDPQPSRLGLTLNVPDGDQGYPGALSAEVEFSLPGRGVIEMTMRARCTAPTPVGLTQHAYFNLDGRRTDARLHRLQLGASRYLPVDEELIPVGGPVPVEGTPHDFRTERTIASSTHGSQGDYDHAYLLDVAGGAWQTAARLRSSDGRVGLHLQTDLPAIQLYTGACLDREIGPDGQACLAHGGIAIEPQYLPDSPNHPEWPQPDCWLQPGALWRRRIRYQFEVDPAGSPAW